MNFPRTEPSALVDSLRDFLKNFQKASKCLQIPLLKPKIEIGSTKSKDNLLAHYYRDIIEHPNRIIRLSFRFGDNTSYVFSIKEFELLGNQFINIEIVKFNPRENHQLSKKRYYVENKCETFESNYDVYHIHP